MRVKRFLSALLVVTMLATMGTMVFAADASIPTGKFVELADLDVFQENLPFDFGGVFTVENEGDVAKYSDWAVDFEISFSKNASVILAGQYDWNSSSWVPLVDIDLDNGVVRPFQFKANTPVKVLYDLGTEAMAKMYPSGGNPPTEAELENDINYWKNALLSFINYTYIKDKTKAFQCAALMVNEDNYDKVAALAKTMGATLDDASSFVMTPPGTKVSLQLCMYNVDANGNVLERLEVGEPIQYEYATIGADDVADEIAVELRQANGVADEIELYLKSTDNTKVINGLTSAGLKFYLDTFNENGEKDEEAEVEYTLIPAENVTITEDLAVEDAYAFNYDGKKISNYSDDEIKLATIKLEGYRAYEFGVDSKYDVTKVSATTFSDKIEVTFVPAPASNQKKLVLPTAGIKNQIKEATRDIVVNVAFNNEIIGQTDAYTDMKVTLVGSNGYSAFVDLGADELTTDANGKVSAKAEFKNVTVPYRYTVTVTGAGYRTATATAVVDEDTTPDDTTDDVFTFSFWNNVKDAENADAIFDGGKEMTKNFLAGDIVKDNNINKYDLSAVVSYFGTRDITTKHINTDGTYTLNKYDLNRDGNIDSEDIAYVLVSFGE